MNALEEKICLEGKIIDGKYIKVSHFINHQIDTLLLEEIGKEFAKRFANRKITKILTVETSGIAYAVAAARYLGHVPVIFAKKGATKVTGDAYQCEVFSFTRQSYTTIQMDCELLNEKDHVLLIDDFLANGNALLGLLSLCEQANAFVSGIGIVIEKGFQEGRKRLKEAGYDVESLAIIKALQNNYIELEKQ